MNPIVRESLLSFVRLLVALLTPFLVSQGIWMPEQSTAELTTGIMAGLMLIWSVWQKIMSRQTLLTALATSGTLTEQQAKAKAQTLAPPVSTPSDVIPVLVR